VPDSRCWQFFRIHDDVPYTQVFLGLAQVQKCGIGFLLEMALIDHSTQKSIFPPEILVQEGKASERPFPGANIRVPSPEGLREFPCEATKFRKPENSSP
jgi:hypothetical protein